MKMDYGQQIALALAAVQQLFTDCSKLLQDCDKTIGRGRNSLFGNEVTRDLSRALSGSSAWMPSALYRYYDCSDVRAGLVTGICICFRDEPGFTSVQVEEPLFILGQIEFGSKKATPTRADFPAWVLWNAYYIWSDEQPVNRVLALEANTVKGIPQTKLVAVPLYSIKSISDVEDLFERLTSAAHPLPSPDNIVE